MYDEGEEDDDYRDEYSTRRQKSERHQDEGSGLAIASLVIGIIGLLAWCIPLVGLPLSIVGLVLGFKGNTESSKGMAMAGIALCTLSLILTLANAALGAYLMMQGENPFVR